MKVVYSILFVLSVLQLLASPGVGDEIILKNGLILDGTAVTVPGLNASTIHQNTRGNVPTDGFWMIDDKVRRYFVHRRLIEDTFEEADLAEHVVYNLKHQIRSRKAGPSTVGGFSGVEPFDEFGRRTVFLKTNKGRADIIQGITQVHPDYVQVTSITHDWVYYQDTKTIPPDTLFSLIEQSSDRSDPNEHVAAVKFFIQAEMLTQAQQELEKTAHDFPELKDWAIEYRALIAEEKAREGMEEVQLRRDAGQHELAYLIAKKAPIDEVSSEVYRKAKQIQDEYEDFFKDRDEAILMLDMLQAELAEQQADQLRSMRATLVDEIRYETIERLLPFLRSKSDDTLNADQKLALAYTGWILGAANATLDLNQAVFLWKARALVLEFLTQEEDPFVDDELLDQLSGLEFVSVERVAKMIPLLPPPKAGPVFAAGQAEQQSLPSRDESPDVSYSYMLPPNYSHHKEFPLLVVLHSSGRTPEEQIRWWGGDENQQGWAQRRGYIVIAPHYCDENATSYDGNTTAHEIVSKSIVDIRSRYRVDSDRIFLVGHEMGADASFDIGMSHPDWFAGVAPITGHIGKVCNHYKENGPDLAWYLVNGERDRNTLENNASVLNQMMKRGQNVVYCDYKSRGFETYFEEQENLFKWMQLQRRPDISNYAEFEFAMLRRSENSIHWIEAKSLRDKLFPEDISRQRSKRISANARKYNEGARGNSLYIRVPGESATIWLSPKLVDFDQRVIVNFNGRRSTSDFVAPSIRAMLTRLRQTGDRQRIYWAKLDL